METAKKGKPFGFYVCALGFTFERMAFYTVKYLLAIWIATNTTSGGLGLDDAKGAAISASFVAWTYITPMIGGYLADHFISPRLCVQIGMLLMGVGYIIAGMATDLKMVWVMIILVAVGTGFFKGNLSGVNGLLFSDQEQLDEAFSIQYSFVNIGSFIGTTFIAVLATSGKMSFTGVFTLCGALLIIDLIWFTIGGKKALGEAGKTPFKKDTREFVSEEKRAAASAPLTSGDKKKVAAVILLTLLSAVFWMLWYMAYMPAYYRFGYGDGALGCILLGVSYLVMVVANNIAGDNGQCSVMWLALVCLLMSVGEMVFSPLGNSFISKFAPAKLLGLLLGVWPIAVFLAQQLYPRLYAFLNTMDFTKGYGGCAVVVIVFGAILWGFSNKLESWGTSEE